MGSQGRGGKGQLQLTKIQGKEKMGRRAGVCIDMIMVTAIMAT